MGGRAEAERADVRRLVPLYAVVLALHVVGIGLFVQHGGMLRLEPAATGSAAYAGAGVTAYLLGVRHAFDADHIAAIDDSTRFLMQRGRRPLGVGLAFSLGHSTVVLALCVAIAVAAQAAVRFQGAFAETGGLIGSVVSVTFLYVLAVVNGVVLVGLVRIWRAAVRGDDDADALTALLARRGLLNRLARGRYERWVRHGWQLYPIGVLFGLGFDTATQVGALGLAAGAAADGALPPMAVIALPLLFAAGMTLCDTTDGVLMVRAYGWSAVDPLRRIHSNITLTGLSVLLAAGVATIQLLQLLVDRAGWSGVAWSALAAMDLNRVGVAAVVLFLALWLGAAAVWRRRATARPVGT